MIRRVVRASRHDWNGNPEEGHTVGLSIQTLRVPYETDQISSLHPKVIADLPACRIQTVCQTVCLNLRYYDRTDDGNLHTGPRGGVFTSFSAPTGLPQLVMIWMLSTGGSKVPEENS